MSLRAITALTTCAVLGLACSTTFEGDPARFDRSESVADASIEAADGGAPTVAEPIATLLVPSDGTPAISPILEDAVAYRFVATGAYVWGGCDATACPSGGECGYERGGDAGHRSDDCWATTTSAFPLVSLYIDDVQVDWGAYSSDHVYTIDHDGAGEVVGFNIADCAGCYGDNSGSLTVAIYAAHP
jgi:hypothetical protein